MHAPNGSIGTCDECSEHARRKFPASPEISLLGLRLGVITKRFQEQAFKAVSARITPQVKADCACNLRFLGSVCMLRWLGALKTCSHKVQRYRGSLYLYTCSFGCVHSCCTLNTHTWAHPSHTRTPFSSTHDMHQSHIDLLTLFGRAKRLHINQFHLGACAFS